MATTKQLLDRVKALDTDKVINEALDETMDAIEGINRERMLDGVKADGKMMPHYSKKSVEVYGKPDGPIKLFDEGKFQAGLVSKRDGNNIHTASTDTTLIETYLPDTGEFLSMPKNQFLVENYGENIYGLGQGEYKKKYQDEHLRPSMNKKITAATGLKFGK